MQCDAENLAAARSGEREREAGKSNGNLLKQKIVKHNWHCTEYLLCAVKRLISLITEQRNAHVGNN